MAPRREGEAPAPAEPAGAGAADGRPTWREYNKQAKVSIAFTACETAASALRSGDALSALVLLQAAAAMGSRRGEAGQSPWKGANTMVGLAQGLNGTIQLLVALPSGAAADRWRRDRVLRVGLVLGVVAMGVLGAAVEQDRLWPLLVAMGCVGTYKGCVLPTVETIFADSVPSGRRTEFNATKYVVRLLSASLGPLTAMGLFLTIGNHWKPWECGMVVLVGVALTVPALFLLLLFDDDETLGAKSENLRGPPTLLRPGAAPDAASPLSGANRLGSAGSLDDGAGAPEEEELMRQRMIPYLIIASDILGALAAGMTLKFFSLFFLEECGFSPAAVSAVSAGNSLVISALVSVGKRAAGLLGKVGACILFRFVDVALLLGLVVLPTDSPGAHAALVVVHLLRMGVANATSPLLRATLMDNVPKSQRAKWNAVDGIKVFSWSGSAALGGFLIDRMSFQSTFFVTAMIKLAAVVPLFGLWRLVGTNKDLTRAESESRLRLLEGAAEQKAVEEGLDAPLLGKPARSSSRK